jgi:hypothetical protein
MLVVVVVVITVEMVVCRCEICVDEVGVVVAVVVVVVVIEGLDASDVHGSMKNYNSHSATTRMTSMSLAEVHTTA